MQTLTNHLLPRPTAGLLILTDADRSDFLHRMTTNNINTLKPGQSAVTVLTSGTARIVFVFTVLCRADELWLLPAPGETEALARHLRGQIFFMDKVKLRNASSEYQRLRLLGATGTALYALGIELTDAADGTWQANAGVVAVKQLNYDLPGYELLITTEQAPSTLEKLIQAGATLLDDEQFYEAERVALGRPAPGHELTGDYNPLEAGLAWSCAENKGCYSGQEIIARQVTYDKVTKTLVGLHSAELLPAGSEVNVEGRAVGHVTSSIYHTNDNRPLALAILKRPYNEAGTRVQVGDQPAQVVALPFHNNQTNN